ncbi:hypothetical protein [Candidatus Enterococcus clewellii]|uniref:WxL domain-containing protein n=1 Tax=Candidatus Enterococcus clewellii TaxID=1834193 RepID=A0A242K6K4_9ENTE|nr:hypothetical protein [Enterococcus sp. 9E7_DIV0242]OTP15948.1 hypothetical protein A5888_002162 [Enterococcus sp. 9E7_DIV0242]
MKKIWIKRIIIALVMTVVCCCFGQEALANRQTKVSYDHASSYTLIIPAKVQLSFSETTELVLSTVNRNLSPSSEVEVRLIDGLTADGEITLSRENASEGKLVSSIKTAGNDVTSANRVVGSFKGFVAEETPISVIDLGIPQGNKLAGDYKTELVFSASYK